MTTFRISVTAACLCAALAACSKSGSTGSNPVDSGIVGVTASRKAVVANGVNSVVLSVTDTAGGPVMLTSTRGTFQGGGGSATVNGATGTATLITCNASTDASCAGNALVTASHGTGTASVSITFGALATVCSADCAGDAACPGHACVPTAGGTGTCSGTTPSTCVSAAASCTPSETPETTCSDGADNDCDGAIDCADSNCDNQPCQVGSPTFLCKSGVCTDTTSGIGISITPARTRLPADGTTTTTIAVKVTSGSSGAGGMGITISTDLGAFGGAASTTGTTGADGVATFTYTASASSGVATLTAFVTAVPALSKTATITMPALGSLAIGPMEYTPPVLGVRSSGFQEFGRISALVLDDTGSPYPDGLAVRFEHRRLGGSTLGAPLTADTGSCAAASGCVGYAGVTSSGTGTPDSTGQAVAWLYSGTVAGTLVTTATATAGGATRTITLPNVAVVGAKANGANFSIVCAPTNIPALADTDCSTSFVDAPFTCQAMLKDRYDNLLGTQTQVAFASEAAAVGQVTSTPAYDPANPKADLGTAVQIFNTLGAGLPYDVTPAPGEPSVTHGLDACGTRTHNPRDGVVTIIAIADGEEAFFDSNGNGVYDPGEPFIDQGEPFVDANDNGARDADEWFLDVNGNGTYDGPNGVWDAATKIWTQTVVVYTGEPVKIPSGGNSLGTRWADAAGFADGCTATPGATSFAFSLAGATHSADYVVVASDMNLNRLDAGTGYEVKVVTGGISALYRGLASYADDLGFFYRYWPCDRTGSCAAQCRATGAALPCVMTPTVGPFLCGTTADVTITAGSGADPGMDEVDWRVTTPYKVFGTGKSVIDVERLFGTSVP